MKIHKIYPSFYNGVTEQPPELVLDNQCKEMINCVPDLIKCLHRRPPVTYKQHQTVFNVGTKIFHTYDRGEDNEEYIFMYTGDYNTPIQAYNKNGVAMNVVINTTNATAIKNYLSNAKLKALTVQDRTWIVNTNKTVISDTTGQSALAPNYNKVAYYWLKRGSGDKYNPYNYAVYLNGTTYACNPDKPGSTVTDPPTGFEDSNYAANYIKGLINGVDGFVCNVSGSILQIYKADGSDFTFDSWDSWGDEASEGWKGSVNKITDLPKDFHWVDTYIAIIGDNTDNFTNYYVKWNGTSWEETRHPAEVRGKLSNMPIKMDRTSLIAGIATFTINIEDWSMPRVGNTDNNSDPSFVGSVITDVFFYKNRFGVASTDSIVMTEAANYTNFYIKTALDVVDTDPIDLAVVSNKASKIYHAKPFNNSLYIFTGTNQFELTHQGALTPTTVSIDVVTNYPMSTAVEPIVINNSMFFISNTGNKQQLREYFKNEKLTVEGTDLNITTPNYLSKTITKVLVNGVLGFVICCTTTNEIYVYNYKDNSGERVQSAWSKWVLLEGLTTTANSFEYALLDSELVVVCKTASAYIYHTINLNDIYSNNKIDVSVGSSQYPINTKIVLPDYYPHLDKLGTPKDKILLKKMIVQGTGTFDVLVYRKDYDKTFVKSHNLSFNDLDMHISSKVGNVDISIVDNTINDFSISSVILEGLFTPTSKEKR